MILSDVNLWVYAFRADSPSHESARARLERARQEGEPFLFVPSVASSFLHLVTNPKIFRQPSSLEESWEFLTVLQNDARALQVVADEMAFGLFKHLCLVTNAVGNAVPDAFLAALAIRFDATLLTFDRDFPRFQVLKCEVLSA